MAQTRVGKEGIEYRKKKIAAWEAQIEVWNATREKSPGLAIIREATEKGTVVKKKQILDRVKTLSFSTEADRLDLAKLAGELDGLESVYYDIADADKKIETARSNIARLVDEIERAKKGELLESVA